MNYYDIDDILAEEERITSIFQVGALHLGALQGAGSHNENLDEGSRVELPLWLSRVLRTRNMVEVRAPPYFAAHSQTNLKSNARNADLKALSPYYYEVGIALARMVRGERQRSLVPDMTHLFAERVQQIVMSASNSRDSDVSEISQRLTSWEHALFASGFEQAEESIRWRQRDSVKLRSHAGVKRRRLHVR